MFLNENYNDQEGIKVFKSKDSTVQKVMSFYKDDPFPNYELIDDRLNILKKGDENLFTLNLKKFLGHNKKILEVGSGTCQLSTYLAIGSSNSITAFDANYNSLKIGRNFAKNNDLKNIEFVCGDIFEDIFKENYFDAILCNGVLHHTKDTFKALNQVTKYLKVGGLILVGLYNKYGRTRTYLRKMFYKIFGKKFLLAFDPVLRKTDKKSEKKINAWIKDQYNHPVERAHTFDELILNFKKNNIEFYNSFPSCDYFNNIYQQQDISKLFQKCNTGTKIERMLAQLNMIFNRQGGEGGLYIFLGHKC